MENNGKNSVRAVGNIDKEIYSCITKDIVTEEVVITDERIEHIKKRHPKHFEAIEPYLKDAIRDPDFIIEDMSNTGLILKKEGNLQFQIVLRIMTSADDSNFKNSVLSAWIINEKRWGNYLRNKNILYRKE